MSVGRGPLRRRHRGPGLVGISWWSLSTADVTLPYQRDASPARNQVPSPPGNVTEGDRTPTALATKRMPNAEYERLLTGRIP
jgi:hypothetical protein